MTPESEIMTCDQQEGVAYCDYPIINDAAQLATLTVFYPKVFVPYLYFATELRSEHFIEWDKKQSPLFQEGVLIRLAKPPDVPDVSKLLSSVTPEEFKTDPKRTASFRSGFLTAAWHILRTDITVPRIFLSNPHASRVELVTLEAFAAFKYLLPKLNGLGPDEILELRQKVKDTREGFTMHLQKLSNALDGMIKAGDTLKELSGYAQRVVETELIPDYREFRRQIEADTASGWKRALDVAGNLIEIDAAPWTPKFWGLLLKALGMSAIETAADQKERLSNRYQGYEFMKEVEDTGGRMGRR